jgi:hypothetical protein
LKKWIGAYALLVIVPLAALAGILHAGSGLSAPHHVAGEWRIKVSGYPTDTKPGDAATLTIVQSGTHLSVGFDRADLRGRLHGDSLSAERRSAPVSTCHRGGLTLRARVDTTARPLRMAGTIGTIPRGHCPELPFTAVRAEGGR